jgi:hypothetical protein
LQELAVLAVLAVTIAFALAPRREEEEALVVTLVLVVKVEECAIPIALLLKAALRELAAQEEEAQEREIPLTEEAQAAALGY